MNHENFNIPKFLHENFNYPFPTLKNPHADQLQEIADHEWINGKYLWIYEDNADLRKKYKKTKTSHIAAYFFPTASPERFTPICRLMLWAFYNDDLYEESESDNIEYVKKQSVGILNGTIEASLSTIPLRDMLASTREDLQKFIPPNSMVRLSQMVERYFQGLEEELKYKKSKKYPTLEECIAFREKTVCLYPFLQLLEVDLEVVFPLAIHEDTVIRRLQALISRMAVFFNDVQSVIKDEATESIYYNTVKVIQNKYQVSLEKACVECLRLHNKDLEEFLAIRASLPDFGFWHDAVVKWVDYMSFMLSGWKAISADLDRYNTTGFPSVLELQKRLTEIE